MCFPGILSSDEGFLQSCTRKKACKPAENHKRIDVLVEPMFLLLPCKWQVETEEIDSQKQYYKLEETVINKLLLMENSSSFF